MARRSLRLGLVLRGAAVMSLAGLGALGSGCQSGGRGLVSAQARANALTVNHEAYATLGYRLAWRGFPLMTERAKVKFFDILGDVVVVQETSSQVSVLEAASGATRWSDQLANPLTKFVGNIRDGNRLICSSESQAFFLDVQTGNLLDKQHLDKVVNTRPVQSGAELIYGTASGEVFAHLTLRGLRLWGNSLPGAIEVNPVVVGDTIGFVSQTGEIAFLTPDTGSSTGRSHIAGGAEVEPAASDTMMFVASLDHSLYGFRARDGSMAWRKRTEWPIRHQPVYHDGRVYCTIEGEGMVAFDAETGSEVWVARGVGGQVVGMRKDRLITFDGHDAVTLDPKTGDEIDRIRLESVAFLKMDAFVDGNLYAVSPSGVVAKFIPRF